MSYLENNKFEAGKKYQMRFIGNADLKVQHTCVKVTAKTATFQKGDEVFTKKIKLDTYGNEYVLYGVYSMAPAINSKHVEVV